jgi:hypothetical protein
MYLMGSPFLTQTHPPINFSVYKNNDAENQFPTFAYMKITMSAPHCLKSILQDFASLEMESRTTENYSEIAREEGKEVFGKPKKFTSLNLTPCRDMVFI